MSNLIFIKDNDNNVGIGSNIINDIKGNINITQNLSINRSDAPDYPLHVGPSNRNATTSSIKAWAYYDVTSVFHFGESSAATFSESESTNPNYHISAKFDNNIWVDGSYIILSSDSRIKTNIVDVPDNLSLQQLRTIPCRYYEYIDKLSRGPAKTIGFIAQEVKSVIPMAVTQQKKIIPNVYKVINCSWTSNNDTFSMSSSDLSNVNDVKYKFYVSNATDASDEKEIILTGNSDNTFTFDAQYTNVFCYGSEIGDFHTLDKNKLFTLNFSATQEIDRIQQTHITEIASLKAENQQQQTEINTLKTENTTLKSVIDKLKTANSFEEFKNSL
jgi:hypothetical protein